MGKRLPPLTSSLVPSTAEISALVFQKDSQWGTGVAGKRGVRFISADEKKQKRGVSSFPRWVGLSGVAERGAGMPLVPGRADRRLGLTPLAILVLSVDTITKRNWGRKVLSVLRHSLSAKKARGETQGCG